ncbi:Outer membrane protein (porin) [Bradyrhizobium erythrophlei]|uniref:Outer membrane protein (Porin) n=2 Tax=Bradyrhizobium erythrophlei TaxID=1437360 RepID=A0A1M7U5K7_9BRAD|nr:Outer membrane protein (porin) [Bradyrhizobium erythrophlei]
MKIVGVFTSMIFGLAAAVYATAALADDIIATKAVPAATTKASLQPATCSSLEDFVVTACPLTWNGITVYGTIDMGVTWLSHGAPFNGTSAVGAAYLVQKYSNRAQWSLAPNGLSNSNIGIKGKEPLAPGWDFIFDLQAGFDPYSLHLSNGPHSVTQNAGIPLTSQDAGADSSRAGQFYNSVGYLGVSSPYGTLTVFRQNSLTLDAVFAYDPMGASYAFSPIGWQGITCGAGNTETCRFSTSAKYRVDVGQFRVAALWQFGGYDLNNGSTGAYQLQLGGDVRNLAGGTLSLDAIGSYVQNAVSVVLAGNTLPAVLPQVLTATLSNNTSVMLVGKYSNGPLKLFAGYEFIQYAPPSNPFAPGAGFSDIAGDFVCAGCTAINNTNINNTAFSAGDKSLHVFWTGVKYAITNNLDVTGAYYHYDQPAFGALVNCANSAAFANCRGTFDAVSFVADWQFAKKFDAYAGIMFSQVNGGLANGYLNRNTIDPTVGLRFRF